MKTANPTEQKYQLSQEEIEMFSAKTCLNCTYFFTDQDDDESNYGVCMMDNAFDPYAEELVDFDFSQIRELYQSKRFEGSIDGCEHFETAMIFDDDDEMENEKTDSFIAEYENYYRNLDVTSLINSLKDLQLNQRKNILAHIEKSICYGNNAGYQAFLAYYQAMGPAEDIEDVYFRKAIVDTLKQKSDTKEVVDVLIQELYRSPSNNTTKQLYKKILDVLHKVPADIRDDAISHLLSNKKFAPKMHQKILEVVIGKNEQEERFFFW